MASAVRAGRALAGIPQLWAAGLLLAASLQVVCWSHSYPVSIPAGEASALAAVSPLFWIGLWGAVIATAGLVLASRSPAVHCLATMVFVVVLSSPHCLYLAWGSDAGVLADMVRYSASTGRFDLARDLAVSAYFQWPLSAFFGRLAAETMGVDPYMAVQAGFLLVAPAVGGGLFALWHGPGEGGSVTSRSAFWAVASYFAGAYWLLNWQAVPYATSLVFLIPILALRDAPTRAERGLLLLLFVAGIESHALVGAWTILVFLLTTVWQRVRHRPLTAVNLTLILIVIQAAVLLYKNLRFFRYAVASLGGAYRSLIDLVASDRALIRQTLGALGAAPLDGCGRLLKVLSWLDLTLIGLAFALAAGTVIRRRRLAEHEAVVATAGAAHFALGTQLAAVGTRAVQLIALFPAACVATSLRLRGRARRWILTLALLGVVLMPAAVLRSHQTPANLVAPAHVALKDFLRRHPAGLPADLAVVDEGRISVFDRVAPVLLNPFTIQADGCQGPFLLADSARLRAYAEAALADRPPGTAERGFEALDGRLTTAYDNGTLALRLGGDCAQLRWLWEGIPGMAE